MPALSADNAFEPIRFLTQLPEVVRHPMGGNTPALSPDNVQGGRLATLFKGSLAKDGSDETARHWERDPNRRALVRPRGGAVAFVHASRTIQVETSDKRGRSIGTFSRMLCGGTFRSGSYGRRDRAVFRRRSAPYPSFAGRTRWSDGKQELARVRDPCAGKAAGQGEVGLG